MKLFIYAVVFFFLLQNNYLFSQIIGEDYSKEVLRKEMSFGFAVHSNGFGLNYRTGKQKNINLKFLYDFSYSIRKHPKEIRARNPFFINSKDYVFGKLNRFHVLHAGYGLLRVINHKPYWGGTEIRYVTFGGIALGMSSPIYLYVVNFIPGTYETRLTTERYNPDKHNIDNIYGNGPFAKGFFKITPHLGLYAKAGLNFEFGREDRKIRSIETGICAEGFLNPVTIMAHNNPMHIFFSMYLSINFGSRKDYY